MGGISKGRLVVGAAGFWVAVLLAFWLGTKWHGAPARDAAGPVGGSAGEGMGQSGGAGAQPGAAADPRRGPSSDPANSSTATGDPGPQPARPPRPSGAGTSAPAPGEAEPEDLGAREMAPGEIVELNYEFKSDASRREYEADQKARWEARKADEIVRVADYLADELKLDAHQSDRLRRLLQDESQRRIAVVTDLVEGRIDQTDFRRRVDAIRETARRELDTIFTPEQLAHYQTLAPRKKVLLDSTIQGH